MINYVFHGVSIFLIYLSENCRKEVCVCMTFFLYVFELWDWRVFVKPWTKIYRLSFLFSLIKSYPKALLFANSIIIIITIPKYCTGLLKLSSLNIRCCKCVVDSDLKAISGNWWHNKCKLVLMVLIKWIMVETQYFGDPSSGPE